MSDAEMYDYVHIEAFRLSIGDVISYEFTDVEITDIALGHDDKIVLEFFEGNKQRLIRTWQHIEFPRSTT